MNWYLHVFSLATIAMVALQVWAVYDPIRALALWYGGSSVGLGMVLLAAVLLMRKDGDMIMRTAFIASSLLAMILVMIFPKLDSLAGMIVFMLILILLAFPVLGGLFELKVVSLVGLSGLGLGYGMYFYGVCYYFMRQQLPYRFSVFAITGPAISILTFYVEAIFLKKKRERRGLPLFHSYGST